MAIVAGAANSGNNSIMAQGMQPSYQTPSYAQTTSSQQHNMMPAPHSQSSGMGTQWNSSNNMANLAAYGAAASGSSQQSGYGLPPQQHGNQSNLLSSFSGIGAMNPLVSSNNPGSVAPSNVGGMLEQLKQLQALASFQSGNVPK